jgi:CRISPR/Cas system CSM-associated protein Csm3 (group 7 of RAMP superfamily)
MPVEIRDGVGIDREWGCAAEQIKYDRAVLPRGTRLPLELTAEFKAEGRQAVINMIAALRTALEAGDIRLGAAKTRGLGRVCLKQADLREQDLANREGILSVLRDKPGNKVPKATSLPNQQSRLEITIDWQPVGPLMVKAGADGIGVDSVPLVSGIENGHLSLVLPGSSLKGAFRSQAERVVRTLLNLPVSQENNARRRFLRHLEEVPLIEAVFGAPGKRKPAPLRTTTEPALGQVEDDAGGDSGDEGQEEEDLAAQEWLGLGALTVDDCYGKVSFTREQWQAVLAAAPEALVGAATSPLRQALAAAGLTQSTAAFHVAIDRWTGGAAESLLYTVLETHGVSWEPLRLVLDLNRLPADELQARVVMLVLLVLRDMAKGRVPLGFATNRGMGSMAVNRIRFAGHGLPKSLVSLHEQVLENGEPAHLPDALRHQLKESWQKWLAEQQQEETQ